MDTDMSRGDGSRKRRRIGGAEERVEGAEERVGGAGRPAGDAGERPDDERALGDEAEGDEVELVVDGVARVPAALGDADARQHPSYIDTNQALVQFCVTAGRKKVIAVDTEFILERNYWADLCLIQIGHMGGAAVIDPKAEGLDLAPLWRLITDSSIVKVFHAAYEDMLIIQHYCGELPLPAFDTQVAATFCLNEDSPGYGSLVKQLFGETVDKSQQRSAWAKRPLLYRQVDYALHDVTYLIRAYHELMKRLKDLERLPWFLEDSAYVNDPKHYRHDPYLIWRRLSPRGTTRRGLAVLREVAAWRELHARQRDMPARWVMQDHVVEQIAQNTPRSEEELQGIRAIPASLRNNPSRRRRLWAAIERGLGTDDAELPRVRRVPKDSADHRLMELLRVLLSMVCREYSIAPGVVANAADLRQIATSAAGRTDASRLLRGWRHDLYGNAAYALKQGNLRFGYHDNRTITTDTEGTPLVKVKAPTPEMLLPRPIELIQETDDR